MLICLIVFKPKAKGLMEFMLSQVLPTLYFPQMSNQNGISHLENKQKELKKIRSLVSDNF